MTGDERMTESGDPFRQATIGTRVTTAQRCCRVDAWRPRPIPRSPRLLNNLRDVPPIELRSGDGVEKEHRAFFSPFLPRWRLR
jgi:hypothetical protein